MTARILAYHRICDSPEAGLETWSVKTGAFRRQMNFLRRLGYRGVSLRELLAHVDSGAPSGRLVALTFDDGYQDTIDVAAPILAEHGFTASLYIVPDYVGGAAGWDGGDAAAPLAGWSDLRSLVEAGWEVGLHSRSHTAQFDSLEGLELDLEIRGGLERARERLETEIDSFAFPYGRYSDAAITCLRAAGYRAALTSEDGPVRATADRFTLPRYEIKRRDTLLEFWLIVAAGLPLRRRATLFRFGPAGWGARRPEPAVSAADESAVPSDRERDAA
jgi:peptidoglycan/xylan/chitin deacetylase (PgdA/CDA1 family)